MGVAIFIPYTSIQYIIIIMYGKINVGGVAMCIICAHDKLYMDIDIIFVFYRVVMKWGFLELYYVYYAGL